MEFAENRLYELKKLDLNGIGGSRVVHARLVDSPFDESGKTIPVLRPAVRVMLESVPGEGSYIRHEAWLPLDWNGILVGKGNSGMAGRFHSALLCSLSDKGYAVIQTDMGMTHGRERGVNNKDLWKDFGWRSTHIMTQLGKYLASVFYDRPVEKCYFMGASTGGQQALAEAQRYPEDYDGIIAGVPANNRTHLHTCFLWNHNHLTHPDGKGLFTDDEIALIADSAVEFFTLRGGAAPGDRFVSFPETDEQTVKAFISFLERGHPAFSRQQLDALKAVYSGPVDPVTGRRIYSGMPIGSEANKFGIAAYQSAECPHIYPFVWAFGENYTGRSFNFSSDMAELDALLAADLNAVGTDLSGFSAHGGRLILYSGTCDPCIGFTDTLDYVRRLYQDNPDAGDFIRYFLIPGRNHDGDGKGFNFLLTEDGGDELELLRRWCEKEKSPDTVWVSRSDVKDRRLIAAWSPERSDRT